MKRILILTFLVSSFCACAQDTLTNTKFEQLKLANGTTLNYAIHLPDDYDPNKSYPTIIGPGAGTRDETPSYYWHGSPSAYGWIIVESRAHFLNDPVSSMRQLLDHLNANYNVEGDRFHMVGYSANSAASFRVGIALAEKFHSLVGVAGYPRKNPVGSDLERLKDTKFFFIVGDQDRYWMNASEKAHAYLKSKNIDTTLEIIKNGQHVLRKVDGRPFIRLMERMR